MLLHIKINDEDSIPFEFFIKPKEKHSVTAQSIFDEVSSLIAESGLVLTTEKSLKTKLTTYPKVDSFMKSLRIDGHLVNYRSPASGKRLLTIVKTAVLPRTPVVPELDEYTNLVTFSVFVTPRNADSGYHPSPLVFAGIEELFEGLNRLAGTSHVYKEVGYHRVNGSIITEIVSRYFKDTLVFTCHPECDLWLDSAGVVICYVNFASEYVSQNPLFNTGENSPLLLDSDIEFKREELPKAEDVHGINPSVSKPIVNNMNIDNKLAVVIKDVSHYKGDVVVYNANYEIGSFIMPGTIDLDRTGGWKSDILVDGDLMNESHAIDGLVRLLGSENNRTSVLGPNELSEPVLCMCFKLSEYATADSVLWYEKEMFFIKDDKSYVDSECEHTTITERRFDLTLVN